MKSLRKYHTARTVFFSLAMVCGTASSAHVVDAGCENLSGDTKVNSTNALIAGGEIQPMRMVISSKDESLFAACHPDLVNKQTEIRVRNNTDSVRKFRVSLKAWIGYDSSGKFALEETNAFKNTEQTISVAPLSSTPVRYEVLKRTAGAEDSYRVTVEEIFTTPATVANPHPTFSFPLFVVNDLTAHSKLILTDSDKNAQYPTFKFPMPPSFKYRNGHIMEFGVIKNAGSKHAQALFTYFDAAGLKQSGMRYVLPGQEVNLANVVVNSIEYNELDQ